jgi:hypothetical protein
LKKSIEDMETTRKQVPSNGLAEFDRRVGPSYDKASAAIDSFMKFQTKYKPAAPRVTAEINVNEDNRTGIEIHG